MKILHVTYICPPRADVADGITQVVYSVTRKLAERGHEVTVYASNYLGFSKGFASIRTKKLVINGVEVNYFPALLRHHSFMVTPKCS